MKVINRNRIVINLSIIYWIIQAVLLFNIHGFGIIPEVTAVCVLTVCVLRWVIPGKKYFFIYGVLMILYSFAYAIANVILLIFFKQENSIFSLLLSIIALNFIVSIGNLIFVIKK